MSRAGTKARRRAATRAAARASEDAVYAKLLEIRRTVQIDDSIDAVYDWLDELLLAEKFAEVDAILKRAEPVSFKDITMLAFATITLSARDRLSEHAGYVARARAALVSRGRTPEDINDMLEGLE